MKNSSGSQDSKDVATNANLTDLEADGMVSVYVNNKFTWQLPKKLLSLRIPTVLQEITAANGNSDSATVSDTSAARWEITEFSVDAFRLFTDWLYNPRGVLKEPASGASSQPYFELNKFAARYKIRDLLASVKKILKNYVNSSTNLESMSEAYESLAPKEGERAMVSGHFAALILTKTFDMENWTLLNKSNDLTHDILLWVTVYLHHGKETAVDHEKILTWMRDNSEVWYKAHE